MFYCSGDRPCTTARIPQHQQCLPKPPGHQPTAPLRSTRKEPHGTIIAYPAHQHTSDTTKNKHPNHNLDVDRRIYGRLFQTSKSAGLSLRHQVHRSGRGRWAIHPSGYSTQFTTDGTCDGLVVLKRHGGALIRGGLGAARPSAFTPDAHWAFVEIGTSSPAAGSGLWSGVCTGSWRCPLPDRIATRLRGLR